MDASPPPPTDPVAPPPEPATHRGPVRVTLAVTAVAAVVAVVVVLAGVGRGGDVSVTGSTTPSVPPATAAATGTTAPAAATVSPTTSTAPSPPEFCSVLVTAQLLRGRASVGPRGALRVERGTLPCGSGVAQIRTMRMPLDREGGELVTENAGTYGRGKGVVVVVPKDLGRCEALVMFAATSTDSPDPEALRDEVLAVVTADKLEKAGTTVFPSTSAAVAVAVTGRASACRPESVSVPEADRADCWRFEESIGTGTQVGCAQEHNAEVLAVDTVTYSDYISYQAGGGVLLDQGDPAGSWADWSAQRAEEFCSTPFADVRLRPGTRTRDVELSSIYPTAPPDALGSAQVVCLAVLRGDRTATKRFVAISR